MGSPFIPHSMQGRWALETTGRLRTILDYRIRFSQQRTAASTALFQPKSGGFSGFGVTGAAAASGLGGVERLVHDLADGAGAAAALGAAAETAIDLPGRARLHLR